MSAASVALSTATGYSVDPNLDQSDGVVFNFGTLNGNASTAAPNNNSPNNPVTPTSSATAATGTGTGSGLSTFEIVALAAGALVLGLFAAKHFR